jgi:hypothetical protein
LNAKEQAVSRTSHKYGATTDRTAVEEAALRHSNAAADGRYSSAVGGWIGAVLKDNTGHIHGRVVDVEGRAFNRA